MNEGSICGLGQAAALPLTTALQHFPNDFAQGDFVKKDAAEKLS
jgi:NADH:ubiquinone oxidoreductase subunit F (NADH-binding)